MSVERLAIWLLPNESSRALLETFIAEGNALSEGPSFVPHLTLSSGPMPSVFDGEAFCAAFALEVAPFELRVSNVERSPIFKKSLFLEFERNDSFLRAVAESARLLEREPLDDPHLSLHYGAVDDTLLQRAVSKFRIGYTVAFDSIALNRAQAPTRTQFDILAWHLERVTKLQNRKS